MRELVEMLLHLNLVDNDESILRRLAPIEFVKMVINIFVECSTKIII